MQARVRVLVVISVHVGDVICQHGILVFSCPSTCVLCMCLRVILALLRSGNLACWSVYRHRSMLGRQRLRRWCLQQYLKLFLASLYHDRPRAGLSTCKHHFVLARFIGVAPFGSYDRVWEPCVGHGLGRGIKEEAAFGIVLHQFWWTSPVG